MGGNRTMGKLIRESLDIDIDDKVLMYQYQNRKEYNPIKRLIIERKYEKALKNKIESEYNELTHKR